MWRRRLFAALAICAPGWAGSAGDSAIAPETTIAAIMAEIVVPASDALWDAAAAHYDAPADGGGPPLQDQRWKSLEDSQRALADAAAALLVDGRPVDLAGAVPADPERELPPERIAGLIDSERAAWLERVRALDSAVVEAGRAIARRDAGALAEAGDVLYGACEDCHGAFWYPQR